MPSPSKAKGSGWEREIAIFLSNLYGESFVRVPNSGAFIGGKNNVRKSTLSEEQIRGFKGDIIPGPSFGKLNLEAKFYKDFPFHQLLQGDCKQIDEWIKQIIASADEADVSLLAMKFNRKGSYIAFEAKHVPRLATGRSYIKYHNPAFGPWYITSFDMFWQLNAKQVKELSSM